MNDMVSSLSSHGHHHYYDHNDNDNVFEYTYKNQNGSYNSFRQQVGFCKLQGFDTVSRTTSFGPLGFRNQDIWIGVGLNSYDFRHDISQCGRCLLIYFPSSVVDLNSELTSFSYHLSKPESRTFLGIVMDECKDDICTSGFLDFDIYSPFQPVRHGNPQGFSWIFTSCPTQWKDVELLFCFSNSCHQEDPCDRTVASVIDDANPFFFSIYLRNTPEPVSQIVINHTIALEKKEGWFWNFGDWKKYDPFHLDLLDFQNQVVSSSVIDFSMIYFQWTLCDFRGGILWKIMNEGMNE